MLIVYCIVSLIYPPFRFQRSVASMFGASKSNSKKLYYCDRQYTYAHTKCEESIETINKKYVNAVSFARVCSHCIDIGLPLRGARFSVWIQTLSFRFFNKETHLLIRIYEHSCVQNLIDKIFDYTNWFFHVFFCRCRQNYNIWCEYWQQFGFYTIF